MRCWKCLPSSSLHFNVRIFNAFITFSNMFGALLISSIFPSNFSILLKVSFLQFISMQFLKKWFQNFLLILCCIYIA
jgi:hypothetical protein